MKESRKEFIIQAHKEACSEWKQNIEKEFPKLFKSEELEVGKWYKVKKPESIIEALICFDNKPTFYGFDYTKGWTTCFNSAPTIRGLRVCTPATDKEVEEALIKEAKKRGFKKGDVIKGEFHKSFDGLMIDDYDMDSPYYMPNSNMFALGNKVLFQKGKWETIIETITKAEAQKELGKTII